MRNSLVQPDENLTPFGQWLAARFPHGQIERNPWGLKATDFYIRLFGIRPLYRFVVLDVTRFSDDWQLTLFGLQLKRNKHFKAGR